jgi:hypothetical protein
MIGKALGSLWEVENSESSGLICRQYLRVKVELNTAGSLNLGFRLPRQGKDPLWISFRYERLGDYCTICGLIGHKRLNYPTPSRPHSCFLMSKNIFLWQSGWLRLEAVVGGSCSFPFRTKFKLLPWWWVNSPSACSPSLPKWNGETRVNSPYTFVCRRLA